MSENPAPFEQTRPPPATLWVTVGQFACILMILATGPLIPSSPLLLVVMGAGIALVAWAVLYNRLGNFNIQPTERAGGRLITGGPYRFIRHPMYSASLLVMLALVLNAQSILRWAIFAALFVDLWLKILIEEKQLMAQFEAYAAYRKKTRRLIPFVF